MKVHRPLYSPRQNKVKKRKDRQTGLTWHSKKVIDQYSHLQICTETACINPKQTQPPATHLDLISSINLIVYNPYMPNHMHTPTQSSLLLSSHAPGWCSLSPAGRPVLPRQQSHDPPSRGEPESTHPPSSGCRLHSDWQQTSCRILWPMGNVKIHHLVKSEMEKMQNAATPWKKEQKTIFERKLSWITHSKSYAY